MHKLMHKGLKKKKKPKKGKKDGEEEEFNPEELERYRRERAEALVTASSEVEAQSSGGGTGASGSDEWKKFQALTAGIDSVLKKTQGDLDRIKSTSFFQRKTPIVEEAKPEESPEVTKNKSKRWIGFDKDGNPIEQQPEDKEANASEIKLSVNETGFVEIPEDEEDEDDSAEEDIFDTTYVDVLQNIDVQLAYIPDSPIKDQPGDDPFDTTNADKVLKTVDKHGKKVVSLGNAVEVLSGRIDHVSTCKISRPRKGHVPNLLLDDVDTDEFTSEVSVEQFEVEKTLLDRDDDSEIPDIPINLTILPPIVNSEVHTTNDVKVIKPDSEATLDISEFEILKEQRILEEIPDLDDELDFDGPIDDTVKLEYAADPFAEKESVDVRVESEIIEASFEVATFVNEEDPFDTAFAENLVPGKVELKFIEQELDQLPESTVSISLTDPSGIYHECKISSLTTGRGEFVTEKYDLLGQSTSDLTQLTDQPIVPAEEITYIDPFDTSGIEEPTPGQTELKFLEKELLDNDKKVIDTLQDDDFDPRKEETSVTDALAEDFDFTLKPLQSEIEISDVISHEKKRKPSRPEALTIGSVKIVAFELPTPSQRPDLLITGDEEKAIASKPLTPYYSRKSIEEDVNELEAQTTEVDPFDTSFVSKVTPGKTELKIIESELLKQETTLTHSSSEDKINTRFKVQSSSGRRQSDFGATTVKQKDLNFSIPHESVIEHCENNKEDVFDVDEKLHQVKSKPIRQESLLDADVEVNAKSLTPSIKPKLSEDELEEEISYTDPFDTSIASNILPGKAELKQLESELNRIPTHIHPIRIAESIDLSKVTHTAIPVISANPDISNLCAPDTIESQDFFSLGSENLEDKVLTPQPNTSHVLDDCLDPFDTSFAVIEPGKTELKLLESELMTK